MLDIYKSLFLKEKLLKKNTDMAFNAVDWPINTTKL